jgi:hypothetical protein
MLSIPAWLMWGALSKSGYPMVNRITWTPRAWARATSSEMRNAFSVPMSSIREENTDIVFELLFFRSSDNMSGGRGGQGSNHCRGAI